MAPERRRFLAGIVAGLMLPAGGRRPAGAGNLFASPVTTNRLRPPGAVGEDRFAGRCIRCGRCVAVCPYRCIRPLDVRSGIYAGTPLISVEEIPCYLCMKCVAVCPTGSLRPIAQEETRMGLAVLDRHTCITWRGEGVLCRTCYNVCPFKEKAIRLDDLRPVVIEENCAGCGLCTHGCPISVATGRRAVNIEPLRVPAGYQG